MKPKKESYFVITGELLLDLIKQKTNLPRNTKLVSVVMEPPTPKPYVRDISNMIRFIISSNEFKEVHEGECLYRFNLEVRP